VGRGKGKVCILKTSLVDKKFKIRMSMKKNINKMIQSR